MPILLKPFLFLVAFGPLAVLFASAFGLACWLLTVCVRAISLAGFTWLSADAGEQRPLGPDRQVQQPNSETVVPAVVPATPQEHRS